MVGHPTSKPSGWAASKKLGRPLNIDGQVVSITELPSISPHLILERVKIANTEALSSCLADSSLRSYRSAMESWCRCATFYGFDAWCRMDDGSPMSIPQCVQLLDLYIGFECALRQMKPQSIRTVYLQGIAKQFDMRRPVINSNFRAAVNDGRVQSLLDGYERAWNKKHPEHGHTKIPFTLILALQTETLLRSGEINIPGLHTDGGDITATIETMRVVCALIFGIFYLLRKNFFHSELKYQEFMKCVLF